MKSKTSKRQIHWLWQMVRTVKITFSSIWSNFIFISVLFSLVDAINIWMRNRCSNRKRLFLINISTSYKDLNHVNTCFGKSNRNYFCKTTKRDGHFIWSFTPFLLHSLNCTYCILSQMKWPMNKLHSYSYFLVKTYANFTLKDRWNMHHPESHPWICNVYLFFCYFHWIFAGHWWSVIHCSRYFYIWMCFCILLKSSNEIRLLTHTFLCVKCIFKNIAHSDSSSKISRNVYIRWIINYKHKISELSNCTNDWFNNFTLSNWSLR